MGPTNVALVKLFQADQALRQAQERLDAAEKNVRVQQRRVNDFTEKHKAAQLSARESQSKAAQLDLDLKSRDAHIEKLRTQQQNTSNNREYQAFLVEISTQKVDRGKVEEEALKAMETVEKSQQELTTAAQLLEAEKTKLATMTAQIEQTVAKLRAEVEAVRPARDAAAAAVSPRIRQEFDRLADRYEGEALAAIARPDRRREEYLCSACNMDLVADIYNKLHSRDEIVFCPSCRRMLYIPEDLPPDQAINKSAPKPSLLESASSDRPAKAKTPRSKPTKTSGGGAGGRRATGEMGKLLTAAQGESVKAASVLGMKPIDVEVMIDGKVAGDYRCQNPGHLERIIRYRLQEAGLMVKDLEVRPRAETPAAPAPVPGETPPVATGEAAAAAAPTPAEPAATDTSEPVTSDGQATQTESTASDGPMTATDYEPSPKVAQSGTEGADVAREEPTSPPAPSTP